MNRKRRQLIMISILLVTIIMISTLVLLLVRNESQFNLDIEIKRIIPLTSSITMVSVVTALLLSKEMNDKMDAVIVKTVNRQDDNQEDNDHNNSFSKIENQLIDNILENKSITEKLFSRSNTCLVVGCIISILGVFVFYLLNLGTEYNSLEISQQLFTLLPRFGILFFIEYVAFFFLKQYRILMEEYRYYEATKRDRQNLLSIYYLVDKYKDEKDILELMNNYIDKHSVEIPKYSGDNRVKMEKSLNEDMDVISKITKLVQVIKTPDKSKE